VDGEQPAAELLHHLARHGVEAEARTVIAKDSAVGALPSAHAAGFGADLIAWVRMVTRVPASFFWVAPRAISCST
jgi:hypothetical protein